jgi:hypothetical protein
LSLNDKNVQEEKKKLDATGSNDGSHKMDQQPYN